MQPEQIARATIDCLLTQAGWDYDTEVHAPSAEHPGRIDYLLKDRNGKASTVLEAKARHLHPLAGKEQARTYALYRNVQHVMLSNGTEHYVWDIRAGNPVRVLAIPSPERIRQQLGRTPPNRDLLWQTSVAADYLPAGSRREMRPYQVAAVHAIQDNVKAGETTHLLEMATGTGKTTVAAALLYLYISTGNAEHTLFLVDRIELKQQAAGEIRAALDNQYTVGVYDRQADYDWERTHVTVMSIQGMDAMPESKANAMRTQFDLTITDEAHRCISGPARRQLFETLEGERIGLTATPRSTLQDSEPDDSDDSVFAREQRSLRDTYVAFGRPAREPTYSYTIEDGRRDGYLVGPVAVDVRTEVTKQLMSDKGLELEVPTDGFDAGDDGNGQETETRTFHIEDYGSRLLSPATRLEMAETILDEALYEPETRLMGKTIVYAPNQSEAICMTSALNEVAEKRWPSVYQSDFAIAVISDVRDAADHGRKFRNNDLNGNHPSARGRHTSKTRVCITVAMMTTGYDCPDLLNVVLCRTMNSPTEFTQVKGRGTRKFDFRENVTDPRRREQMPEHKKEHFKIIDFFGVCEHHNEGQIYQPKVEKEPADDERNQNGENENETVERGPTGPFIHHGPDEVESTTQLEFGEDGMTIVNRIDSEAETAQDTQSEQLNAAFNEYLGEYPIADETQRAAARRLFQSYQTDEAARTAIDSKVFPKLNNTTLPLSDYRLVPPEHRERIIAYINDKRRQDDQEVA